MRGATDDERCYLCPSVCVYETNVAFFYFGMQSVVERTLGEALMIQHASAGGRWPCGQEKSAVSLSARPVCKNNELKLPSVWVSYVCTH